MTFSRFCLIDRMTCDLVLMTSYLESNLEQARMQIYCFEKDYIPMRTTLLSIFIDLITLATISSKSIW